MINKLWEGVSLQGYNDWKPLTGIVDKIPLKYDRFFNNVNDWFETFAIRAQNDWNAYLDFPFLKFPFETWKDPDLKEMLRNMVYFAVEHWIYNRVPIEFFTSATNTIRNGTTFDSTSPDFINAQGLLPSRGKILAQATSLKKMFRTLEESDDLTNEVDLGYWYTKIEVDTLLEEERIIRKLADDANHQFTLDKQLKLYDDVPVSKQYASSLRGPVTNLVIKGPVATGYDPNTETAVFDVFNEIGHIDGDIVQQGQTADEGGATHAISAVWAKNREQDINTINQGINELTNSINSLKNLVDKLTWKQLDTSDFTPDSSSYTLKEFDTTKYVYKIFASYKDINDNNRLNIAFVETAPNWTNYFPNAIRASTGSAVTGASKNVSYCIEVGNSGYISISGIQEGNGSLLTNLQSLYVERRII